MGRKGDVKTEQTALKRPTEEAKARLSVQIQKGKALQSEIDSQLKIRNSVSPERLAFFEAEFKFWNEFNETLLNILFLGDEMIRCYRPSIVGLSWNRKTPEEYLKDLRMKLQERINSLVSILSRVELLTPQEDKGATDTKMGKIRILFVAANPEETGQLALDKEFRDIKQKISSSAGHECLELHSCWAATFDDFKQALLTDRPHIVHFSGHGNGNVVCVATEDNLPEFITKETLKSLLQVLRDNIKIVVLNSCFSDPIAESLTEIVDCTIGMTTEVDDRAAATFAASFYQGIGYSRSIQEAFELGRVTLMQYFPDEKATPRLRMKVGVDSKTSDPFGIS